MVKLVPFSCFSTISNHIYNNIALLRIVPYTRFPFGIYTLNTIVCVYKLKAWTAKRLAWKNQPDYVLYHIGNG